MKKKSLGSPAYYFLQRRLNNVQNVDAGECASYSKKQKKLNDCTRNWSTGGFPRELVYYMSWCVSLHVRAFRREKRRRRRRRSEEEDKEAEECQMQRKRNDRNRENGNDTPQEWLFYWQVWWHGNRRFFYIRYELIGGYRASPWRPPITTAARRSVSSFR